MDEHSNPKQKCHERRKERRKQYFGRNYIWLAAIGLVWLLAITENAIQINIVAHASLFALLLALFWVVFMEIHARKTVKTMRAVFVGFDGFVGINYKGNPIGAAPIMVFESDGVEYKYSGKRMGELPQGAIVYIEVQEKATVISYRYE